MKTPTQIRAKAEEDASKEFLKGHEYNVHRVAFISGAEWMQQESSAGFTLSDIMNAIDMAREKDYINEHLKPFKYLPSEIIKRLWKYQTSISKKYK